VVGSRAREGARVVAGGALREDEKKADRERGRSRVGGSGGRVDGPGGVSDDDGGGTDQVSRTWSRTRRARNEATAGARAT